mgnify:CR=1
MFTPQVPLEAAEPNWVPEEFAAELFVLQAYVYLFLVVKVPPNANIPLVEFPDAAPYSEQVLDDVAELLVSDE